MGRRILNDALRTMVNAEKRVFASAKLQPISNVMAAFLNIMKYRGYIKDFHVHDPHRVGRITVELQGRISDCRALTYRQDIKAQDIEKYRLLKLPTHQWGYVVITTPNGVLDHEEAIRQNVGGQDMAQSGNLGAVSALQIREEQASIWVDFLLSVSRLRKKVIREINKNISFVEMREGVQPT